MAGGARSAALVEALAAAYRVAQRVRRPKAADRYRRALAYACRFLLQLQYGPLDAWWVRRPETVLGGFRASLVDHTLTSDATGQALLTLAAVLRSVSPDEINRFSDPTVPRRAPPPITKETG